jgi:voltage-gated potassium channel
MNSTEANYNFAMKAFMKESPILSIFSLFAINLLIGGYALMVFERPMVETSGQDFSTMANTLWLVVVTMTTVGYGDFFPITPLGRFFAIFECLWGVLLTALVVVSLSNVLEMNKSEEKVRINVRFY